MVITQVQADELLEKDVAAFTGRVRDIVHSSLNNNQIQAAICFAYNMRGWAATPLFGFLVKGDIKSAEQHWLLYDKVTRSGQKIEVQGLKNRRQAELNLFLKPVELA
jgi:lysozyme